MPRPMVVAVVLRVFSRAFCPADFFFRVEVLRELVQTEDKQTVVSKRLSIQVKTLQDYVTRLYRKTGASTRAGLTDLYYETREQR